MAQKAVVDAVVAQLLGTGIALVGMNRQGDVPDDGSDFLQIQFPVANVTRPTVNRPYYREDGAFRLILNTQRGVGLDYALTTAGSLATLFRDRNFDGVRCQVPSSPFLDDTNDNGGYFVATLVIPYTYDFTG